MKGQKVVLPKYITAVDLAACGLSAEDGLPTDEEGGVSAAEFLGWLEALTPRASEIFAVPAGDRRKQ